MATGSVEKAVRADLRRLGISVQDSGIAATAVRLARILDEPEASASGAASAAREIRALLSELAPPAQAQAGETGTRVSPPEDAVARARAAREARRAGA